MFQIAVLIANAVCSYLQPSLYDSIIKIKNLPYLPDIPHASSNFHGIRVEQFMIPNVKYLSRNSTYNELQDLLIKMPRLKAFPVVEDNSTRVLIGSCSRSKLLNALNYQVGPEARQKEANRRIKKAIEETDRRFKTINGQGTNRNLHHGEEPHGEIHNIPSNIPSNNDSAHREEAFDQHSTPSSSESFKKRSQSINNTEALNEASHDPRTRTESTASRFTILPVSSEPVLSTHIEDEDHQQASSHIDSKSQHIENQNAESHFERDRPRSIHGHPSETITHASSNPEVPHTLTGMFRTLTRMSFGRLRHRQAEEDYDLCGDEKHEWELNQLEGKINFDEIGLDTAPFQLVEHSSLFKVHSLFSLLGLNRAYVTKCGKLVGVVSLRDVSSTSILVSYIIIYLNLQLRKAVEKVQAGLLFANSPPLYEVEPQRDEPLQFHQESQPLVGPSGTASTSLQNPPDSGPSKETKNKDLEAGTTV